jgi:hypothetical protein
MFLVDYPSSSHHKLNHCTGHLRPIASRAPVHLPFGWPSPTSLFTTCLVKRTDERRDCSSASHAPTVLENGSIPWAYASEHPPPLYTHKHPGRRSNFIHTCITFPSTFPQHSTMEPAKRMVVGGAWDRLPEEIISLIAIKVAETLEAPLEDLRNMRLCNKAMKRASSSRAITNHFYLEHHYQTTI